MYYVAIELARVVPDGAANEKHVSASAIEEESAGCQAALIGRADAELVGRHEKTFVQHIVGTSLAFPEGLASASASPALVPRVYEEQEQARM